MSTTLNKMTAAQLVAGLRTAQLISRCFGEKRGDWADQWHEKYAAITAELDARCEKAGIFQNPDGTYRMTEFKGSVDEMAERLALLGYLIAKGGGK